MPESPFNLQEKTILITGASSGIGKQIAISIASMGAKVILAARNAEKLTNVKELLDGSGHIVLSLDITDEIAIAAAVDKIPPLDGIVHAAGILKLAPIKILDFDQLKQITETNYLAPVNLTRLLLNKKKIQSAASVVFLTSVNGVYTAVKGFGAYAGSKSALNSISKVMALEYASRKIRFNTIAPGMIKTEMYHEMIKQVSDESVKEDKLKYPLGDYGEPEDVANAAIFLLSAASKWITGTTLVVDGGLTII
ncbi:NAD(P)-dependent dehydrogenase (short-subunit alcohol dehydrogenase family) [Chitinophaga sp. W2I13]|uniref:SDR family NAD(P)-dependent oxidoreductase n=1 Tax=Chitinophaga sp. W2I13 TaxID=3373923 RepID=UPI003D19D362